MTNLFKAEIFKLQRNKSFWVIIGIIAGLSALLHYLVLIDWWQLQNTAFDSAGLSEFNALSTFTVPLFFNLIVSTLAGFFISVEFFGSGGIKNQVLSGKKRSHIFLAKYLVFSFGSLIVTILIPLVSAFVIILIFGQNDLINISSLLYLARGYGLFTLQFLGYTALIMLIAIITEDSGKTIIISILVTIVMFAAEKLPKPLFFEKIYENSIFYQFTEVFNFTMTNNEIIKSILIGTITVIIISLSGILVFNRKEIQ